MGMKDLQTCEFLTIVNTEGDYSVYGKTELSCYKEIHEIFKSNYLTSDEIEKEICKIVPTVANDLNMKDIYDINGTDMSGYLFIGEVHEDYRLINITFYRDMKPVVNIVILNKSDIYKEDNKDEVDINYIVLLLENLECQIKMINSVIDSDNYMDLTSYILMNIRSLKSFIDDIAMETNEPELDVFLSQMDKIINVYSSQLDNTFEMAKAINELSAFNIDEITYRLLRGVESEC